MCSELRSFAQLGTRKSFICVWLLTVYFAVIDIGARVSLKVRSSELGLVNWVWGEGIG